MKKYGFFGGAFNPPTKAHESLARDIAIFFKLDKVYFVPVGDLYCKKDLIEEKQRYKMLNIIKDEILDVTDIELNLTKQLTTAEAFELVNDTFKKSENYFIMGSDNLEKLPFSKDAKKCLNNKIIVIKRGKEISSIVKNNILLKQYCKNILEYNNTNMEEYSSTQVRKAIKDGKKEILNEMLNSNVYEYIKKEKLYL